MIALVKNFCDACGTDRLDAGAGLCGGCADDAYDAEAEREGDPWALTPEQQADLEARIAKRLAEPISLDPPF